jgi:chromate reductase
MQDDLIRSVHATPRAAITIVGISGSLRSGSYNTALLEAARSLLGADARFEIASLRGIPTYDEDLRAEGWPTVVTELAERIRAADAVVITTPEYNFSIPGGLKNAIDWLSRLPDQPFDAKPVGIAGASTGRLGTARAQCHLRQCFQYLNARVPNKPEVFVSSAGEAFKDGRLANPKALNALSLLLSELRCGIEDSRRRAGGCIESRR